MKLKLSKIMKKNPAMSGIVYSYILIFNAEILRRILSGIY